MFQFLGETQMTPSHLPEQTPESLESALSILITQYNLQLCVVSNLGISWALLLKRVG